MNNKGLIFLVIWAILACPGFARNLLHVPLGGSLFLVLTEKGEVVDFSMRFSLPAGSGTVAVEHDAQTGLPLSVGSVSFGFDDGKRFCKIGQIPLEYDADGRLSAISGMQVLRENETGRVTQIGNVVIGYQREISGPVAVGSVKIVYSLLDQTLESVGKYTVFQSLLTDRIDRIGETPIVTSLSSGRFRRLGSAPIDYNPDGVITRFGDAVFELDPGSGAILRVKSAERLSLLICLSAPGDLQLSAASGIHYSTPLGKLQARAPSPVLMPSVLMPSVEKTSPPPFDFSQTLRKNLVRITANGARGTGFLASMGGTCYLVTDEALARKGRPFTACLLDGRELAPGAPEIIQGLVRFPLRDPPENGLPQSPEVVKSGQAVCLVLSSGNPAQQIRTIHDTVTGLSADLLSLGQSDSGEAFQAFGAPIVTPGGDLLAVCATVPAPLRSEDWLAPGLFLPPPVSFFRRMESAKQWMAFADSEAYFTCVDILADLEQVCLDLYTIRIDEQRVDPRTGAIDYVPAEEVRRYRGLGGVCRMIASSNALLQQYLQARAKLRETKELLADGYRRVPAPAKRNDDFDENADSRRSGRLDRSPLIVDGFLLKPLTTQERQEAERFCFTTVGKMKTVWSQYTNSLKQIYRSLEWYCSPERFPEGHLRDEAFQRKRIIQALLHPGIPDDLK